MLRREEALSPATRRITATFYLRTLFLRRQRYPLRKWKWNLGLFKSVIASCRPSPDWCSLSHAKTSVSGYLHQAKSLTAERFFAKNHSLLQVVSVICSKPIWYTKKLSSRECPYSARERSLGPKAPGVDDCFMAMKRANENGKGSCIPFPLVLSHSIFV